MRFQNLGPVTASDGGHGGLRAKAFHGLAVDALSDDIVWVDGAGMVDAAVERERGAETGLRGNRLCAVGKAALQADGIGEGGRVEAGILAENSAAAGEFFQLLAFGEAGEQSVGMGMGANGHPGVNHAAGFIPVHEAALFRGIRAGAAGGGFEFPQKPGLIFHGGEFVGVLHAVSGVEEAGGLDIDAQRGGVLQREAAVRGIADDVGDGIPPGQTERADKRGGKKEDTLHAKLPEDGGGDFKVIEIAVVEGDEGVAAGARVCVLLFHPAFPNPAFLNPCQRLVESNRVKAVGDELHLSLKFFGGGGEHLRRVSGGLGVADAVIVDDEQGIPLRKVG